MRGDAIERLRSRPPAEVVEKLMTLRGVGVWTANLTAENALGFSNAVPVGDVHAPRIVSLALTGAPGDDDAMLAALEEFRPHRARVVRLLSRAAVRDRPPPKVDRHRREPWRY